MTVCTETSDLTPQVVARGRVSGLGENLELILDGHPDPVREGRLVLGAVEERASSSDAVREKTELVASRRG